MSENEFLVALILEAVLLVAVVWWAIRAERNDDRTR